MAARAALQTIQIFNPYVNQGGSFNAYSYYDHGVETQENFRDVFPVTDQCERSAQLMGDDYVRLKFNLTAYVPMAAFSFIRYDGQTFFLMNDYCPHSNGSRKIYDGQGNAEIVSDSYEYDMKFYSVANMLRKPICYRHVKVAKGAQVSDGYYEWDEPEITVSATLPTMYVIIVQSIARYTTRLDSNLLLTQMLATIPTNGLDGIAPSANVKLTADTELATFNFNGDNIADVCTTVANAYSDAKKETEWYIEEDANHSLTLHFCKCLDTQSMNHADDFSYKNTEGINRETHPVITGGLKKVDYSRDESNIPQVIIPYGSERNMTYQAVKGIDEVSQMQSTFGKRLRLKANHTCTINGTQYPDADMQDKGITGAYAVKDKNNNLVPLGVDAHGGIANDQVNTGNEKVEYFDDVYPQCHFVVSKVEERSKKKDGNTIPEYTCEGIVVDAQGQIVQPEGDFYPLQIEEGKTLSVRFESGYLNGREFEIANKTQKKTNPSTGQPDTNYTLRFVIVADGSIEDGTLIPSGNFKPRAREAGGYEGDKFALFNMKMPKEYINYAQEELAQKAYEKLMEYQDTVPDVKCTSDPDSFGDMVVYFGAQYTINSEKLGFTLNEQNRRVPVDFISRVVAYSYKLTKVNEVSFTLSSALVRGVLSEMAAAITNVSYATEGLGQRSINLSRRGWRDASEVADMITSMNTEMMLVGNEKYQFGYTSEILPLHEERQSDNAIHFVGLKVSYGQLQHTQQPYIDYANGGLWQIQPNASLNADYQGNALDGTKPYYVFAVCGTENLEWATVILMDKDAAETNGVYHKDAEIYRGDDESLKDKYPQYLLLGILSSEFAEEKDGQMTYERVFSPTNGFTAIEGGTITTEQIQDANRQLIIDFLSKPPRIIARGGAEIIGNITFKSFKDESGNNVLETLGRNLLRDTAFTKKGADLIGWTFYNGSSSGKTINGCSMKTKSDDDTLGLGEMVADIKNNNRIMLTQTAASGYNTVGETYTLTALVKATTATTVYFGAGYSDMPDQYGSASVGTTWTKITIHAKVYGNGGSTTYDKFFLRLATTEAANTLTFKEVKLEKGVTSTVWTVAPEDIDDELEATMQAVSDLADDGIISHGTEKSTLKKEWQEVAGSYYDGTVNGSYYKARKQAEDYGLTSDTLYTSLGQQFTNLKTAMDAILANMDTDFVLATSGGATYDTKEEFIALWRTYYDAEIALLNKVSDTIDQKEIGGENLCNIDGNFVDSFDGTQGYYFGDSLPLLECTGVNSSGVKTYAQLPAGKYVLTYKYASIKQNRDDTGAAVPMVSSSLTVEDENGTIIADLLGNNRKIVFELSTPATLYLCYSGRAYRSYPTASTVSVSVDELMIQKGTKQTQYQNYYKYLATAFENAARAGTTDIDGGLLMTSLLKLRNLAGNVTAGMSGLTEDAQGHEEPILMWGGANYQQALEAASPKAGQTLPDYKYTDGGVQKLINTLLRKDGLGKIGIFYINDDNVEIIVPNQGKIRIDASTNASRGISIFQTGKTDPCVVVTPKSVEDFKPSPSVPGSGTIYKGNATGEISYQLCDIGLSGKRNTLTFSITNSYFGMAFTPKQSSYCAAHIYVELIRVGFGTYDTVYHERKPATGYIDCSQYQGQTYEFQLSWTGTKTYTNLPKGLYRVVIRVASENIKYNNVFNHNINGSYSYQYTPDHIANTIVGRDGMLTAYDAESMFYVKNLENNGQRIIMKGLPNSGSESGQLYVDGNGNLKVQS